ncbi:DUF2244 domain-containing protein [Sneathiella chinensis]|uniref:Membrane protein n=1 Tax=Sneathiella chinensis TaxID=349750 RepID=A0ABQ5U1N3_9PROT|nr:DUF2244 domain-containing protein [Sneathiella chinensis]GLQ05262.1 membrane protein [Sneathiella chinensis]
MERIERQDETEEKALYSLFLYPHRSLSPQEFHMLMAVILLGSFIAGMVFLFMGAWPVFGFFGLDVLAIYGAFHFNFRAARREDILEIRQDALVVRHLAPDGSEQCRRFQAYWSRVLLEGRSLFVVCRGEREEIGAFLAEAEKTEVKEALTSALQDYRSGRLQSPSPSTSIMS